MGGTYQGGRTLIHLRTGKNIRRQRESIVDVGHWGVILLISRLAGILITVLRGSPCTKER